MKRVTKNMYLSIGSNFGHQMAPLALVPNFATNGVISISFKFGQLYAVLLVLVQNLTNRWRHQHWFQLWPAYNTICIGSHFGHHVALLAWPPDGATCISSKFDHQMAPLALVA